MDKGTWYVACHAWFKGEDGKKVFGQWSEIHQVDVSTITPQTPVISKVTVKGSTVTVKYTKRKTLRDMMWFSVTPLPELTDRNALLFQERIIT